MKRALILCAAMMLSSSSAFAVGGIDLTVGACPPNGQSGYGGLIDCAIGDPLELYGTWAPAEAIPDLVALDGILDLVVLQGDLDVNGFWNFDPAGCNAAGLTFSEARPPGIVCTTTPGFTDAWEASAMKAARISSSILRMTFTSCRSTPLSVVAGQRMFGMRILIDGMTASEAGGPCNGCPAPVCLVWSSGRPVSDGAIQPTELTQGTGSFSGVWNSLSFNGMFCPKGHASGNSPSSVNTLSFNSRNICAPVPVRKHTWGRIKSLYR